MPDGMFSSKRENLCQEQDEVCYKTQVMKNLRRCLPAFLIVGFTMRVLAGIESQENNEFMFQLACQDGNVVEVQRLMTKGMSHKTLERQIWQRCFFGAVAHGSKEVVKLLIDSGAEINALDDNGQTALSVAASGLYQIPAKEMVTLEMIQLLLDRGADVHAGNEVAIISACGFNLNVVKRLVEKGALPTAKALASAVRSGRLNIVEFLLDRGLNPKAILDHGGNLFHEAAEWPDYTSDPTDRANALATWERLLQLGLDPSGKDSEGRTPAHRAAVHDGSKFLNWLSQHHAAMDVADAKGLTPLMLAAGRRTQEAIPILIKAGVNLEAMDRKELTALDHAAEAGLWHNVSLLLASDARAIRAEETLKGLIKTTDKSYLDDLLLLTICQRLVPQIKDIVSFRSDGRTLLIWSVQVNSPALTEFLLELGADVQAADSEGRTALIWAGMAGAQKSYNLLLKAGADSTHKDKGGKTSDDWMTESKRRVERPEIGRNRGGSPTVPVLRTDDLFNAIATDEAVALKRLVTASPALLDEVRGGIRAVHLTASLGKLEMLSFMLEKYPKQREAVTLDGKTAMDAAIAAGQSAIVLWLLETTDKARRAEVLKNAVKEMLAQMQGALMVPLLDAGWRPTDDAEMLKALRLAVEKMDVEAVKRLIPYGVVRLHRQPGSKVSSDPFSSSSSTGILSLAACYESPEIITLILEAIAKEAPDFNLAAELHEAISQAARSGNERTLEALIKIGKADVNIQDDEGRTPLHLAVSSYNNLPMAQLLIRHGARLDIKDREGRVPAAHARDFGKTKLAEYLERLSSKP